MADPEGVIFYCYPLNVALQWEGVGIDPATSRVASLLSNCAPTDQHKLDDQFLLSMQASYGHGVGPYGRCDFL